MKVIEVNKSFRNGSKKHHLLVLEDYMTQELIEDWCEQEGSGLNYGYTCEWSIVEDPEVIKETIQREIETTKADINSLEIKLNQMKTFISQPNL